MSQSDSLAFASATRLLQLLNARAISAVELLDLYLDRIDRYNPTYNAVVDQNREAARAAAAQVDARRARGGALGPLAGLPMSIKDSFEVEGMRATCGLTMLAEHRPAQDADAVASLREADAVLFGKTNVPAGASDWQSYNPVYGLSRNPWNPERTAGGSSGGPAAAIAAGFSALELGSDIAGSIRVPAHFCGVFGHKPSYGIVPMRGHIPPMPGALFEVPLGVAGPVARSAEDLALALSVLARSSSLESAGRPLTLPPPRRERLEDFRVTFWDGGGVFPVDGAYLAALQEFVESLRREGVTVEDAAPPVEPEEAYEHYLNTLFAIVGAPAPEEAQAFEKLIATDETGYAARLARHMRTTLGQWFGLLERREYYFRAWQGFFGRYDLLLCPAAVVVAFPHMTSGSGVHSEQLARRLSVSGRSVPYFDNFTWPSLATDANLPATVMPTGRTVEGLPAGIQIIGPYLEDYTSIRFARLVEQALGGFEPPPAVRS